MSTFKGFDSVPMQRPKKSVFDLTHDKRLSMGMGYCTPILVTECVPSDKFRGSSEVLLRLAPLLAPIYDQISLWVHFFFVPNRLLWEEWETFITGGRLGVGIDPVTAPIPPRVDIGAVLNTGDPGAFDQFSLPDYMGVPQFLTLDPTVGSWNGKFLDVMPFAAYQLIWSEYYRDRNFVPDTDAPSDMFPLASGTMTPANFLEMNATRNRNYAPDYFTSALPFVQRGQQVLMPIELGGAAPLYVDPVGGATTSMVLSGIEQPGSVATGVSVLVDLTPPPLPSPAKLWVNGADFDGTSTSINDFRSAYALQVWLERNAVGGSRYNESTEAHFGVKPQDSRLQRPEYIGGGRINVKISEVISTAWSTSPTGDVPVGNMSGHGLTYGNTNQFNYFCVEHGFIMGIATILAPSSYQQGLPRMFRRRTFLDYPWPTFAKLGEQAVNDFEIYANPASLTLDADGEYPVFGYQSRYADWKWLPTTNHGDFKTTLLFWTLTREFEDAPVLSAEFNYFDPSIAARIFAVTGSGDAPVFPFWAYVHNSLTVSRPLPYFGVPNTLGFS